jgi:acyl carrier protein
MDTAAFLPELAKIIEVNDLPPTRPLTDGTWDSVAIMSTIALIDERFDVTVSGAELGQCITAQDVLNLIDRTAAS